VTPVVELRRLAFPEVVRRWPELETPMREAAAKVPLSGGEVRDKAGRYWRLLQDGGLECYRIVDVSVAPSRDRGFLLSKIDKDPGFDALMVLFVHISGGASMELFHNVMGAIIALAGRLGCKAVNAVGHPGWERFMKRWSYYRTSTYWIEVPA
jgi:hypothetical protein